MLTCKSSIYFLFAGVTALYVACHSPCKRRYMHTCEISRYFHFAVCSSACHSPSKSWYIPPPAVSTTRSQETAPTSIEVILRPSLVQSDEPSDLRGFLSPTSVYITWQSQAVTHPIMNRALLNLSDRANTDERTPYSVLDRDIS